MGIQQSWDAMCLTAASILEPLSCTASQVGLINYDLSTQWSVTQPLKGIVKVAYILQK